MAEVGAFGASPSDSYSAQFGGSLETGLGLVRGPLWLEVVAGVRRVLPTSLKSIHAVAGNETDVLGAVRLGGEVGRFVVGGVVECGSRLVLASGSTAAGQNGSVVVGVPFIAVGPDVRLQLTGWLHLRTKLIVDFAMRRQRFSVFGEEVADLGVVRAVGGVSLVVHVPSDS